MFEELPLHRVAGNGEGSSEMIPCGFVPPTAQFKLAERGMEERVMDEAVRIRDRMNFVKSTLRTGPLGDSDGTVECHHGCSADRQHLVVARNDRVPVRVTCPMR